MVATAAMAAAGYSMALVAVGTAATEVVMEAATEVVTGVATAAMDQDFM
jgi:hypothetical protein